MNKIELVTREIYRIVDGNSKRPYVDIVISDDLKRILFNTISGRHEIECFFGIEFEQEQVDAWATVQNIIDDVMNLWTTPITGGPCNVSVENIKHQMRENEKRFTERVKEAIGGKLATSKTYGVVGHVGSEAVMPTSMTDDTIAAMKNMPPINRIERSYVTEFGSVLKDGDVMQQCAAKNALDMYQEIAIKSAIYPGKGTPFGLMYAALGLAEAGEVQNKVKKAFRDDNIMEFGMIEDKPGEYRAGMLSVSFNSIAPERRAAIIKELGGALWYIAAVCDEIGATMSEVALQNLDELCGRGERNTLRGDGDDR